MEEVYGTTLEELDGEWRDAVGAPEYVASEVVSRPTAEAQPTIELYTIGSQTVLSGDEEEAVETLASSESVGEPETSDADEQATDQTSNSEDEPAATGQPAGGSCSATNGANGMMDFSAVLLLGGLAAFAVRKRIGGR